MAVQRTAQWHPRHLWNVLPLGFQTAVLRLWHEVIGIVMAAIGLFLLAALLSYDVQDPSFNTATANLPTNWMGQFGASIADLLMQAFGMASFVLPVPLIVWGASLILHGRWQPTQKQTWARIFAWGAALVCLSTGFGATTPPAGWPLPTGLGGLTGSVFSAGAVAIVAKLAPSTALILTAAIGQFCGAAALLYCIGAHPRSIGAAWDTLNLWVFVAGEWLVKAFGLIRPSRQQKAPSETAKPGFIRKIFAWRTSEPLVARRDPIVTPTAHGQTDTSAYKGPLGRFKKKAVERQAVERLDEMHSSTAQIVRTKKKIRQGKREAHEAQPTLDLEPLEDYRLPPLSLLTRPHLKNKNDHISDDALEQNARMLEGVLDDFGIKGKIIRVRPGPVVTLYELEPAAGIKSSRVISLADDIARSMSAVSARVAVVPGRNAIGIELPNSQREIVFLRELLAAPEYENTSSKLALALGKNIGGEPVVADLATMPHLLIAGTTGSGKSVGINTMILSLLYRLAPSQCKLILIDPKMLELSVYDGIPHLLAPVVTDPKKAVVALKWVVREMEDRYRNMSKLGVRNISGYNTRIAEAIEDEETLTRTVQTGFDKETGKPVYEQEELTLEPMPFIVVVVDEMADLMMVAGKDIEGAVQRLAQMARAAGIHLITATQRPSVDVITGTIKANFPTRISFQVTSKVDSRTILGEQGSEQLLGQGDMLYMAGGGRIRRVHGPFVSDQEVEKIVKYLKKQGAPEYLEDVTFEPDGDNDPLSMFDGGVGEGDELYEQAVQIVARDGKASTSYVQRRLQIGYNRAARIIERMEDEGIVSPANHAGKREVLIGEHANH